ncbi:hypothetical protein Syun_010155 [Stephania yunnanensis]|uniref:inositol-1,3,4-trisphosphate 5/6-kinase n=1 Tax=Stephania yunnanensis TaxID=152371 RepID=A0AAP0KFX9_9MAGN
MGAVKALLFDSSVLITEDGDGTVSFQSGAEALLWRLAYSKLHLGVSYGESVSAQKVSFLNKIALSLSLQCFMHKKCSIDASINDISQAWGKTGESCLYVASSKDDELYRSLNNNGWFIVLKSAESADDVVESEKENLRLLYIGKLEELPFIICRFSRKGRGDGILSVGYVMKPSREKDFAKRGAFPMYPTQNGLIFVPLALDFPLAFQMQEVDAVIHKATDEITSVELSTSSEHSIKVTFSNGMKELERYFQGHPGCCIIDPLNKIYPVLDRLRIQQILLRLEDLNMVGRSRIRGPHFLKIDDFKDPSLAKRLSEAKLSLPCIVKPQVACGVADAHSMGIVFQAEDFKDLQVPLPAVAQEYVDHSSLLFKFYVLGDRTFHAVKKSTPNADFFLSSCMEDGLKPIIFDSLKSLPTAKDQQLGGQVESKVDNLDLELVTEAANWLRQLLDLTIFGFDVVIQEGSRDHVIVDVNYLPSFKEVPDDIAVPAFWEAIKTSCKSRSANTE